MNPIKKERPQPSLFLVDNGSLRAEATLSLRRVADRLTSRLGRLVSPVSLLHSSKVPPDSIGGYPAETFIPAVRRRLHGGQRRFLALPFFFGPSRALTEYIPDKVAALRTQDPAWADLEVEVARPLVDLESQPDDDRIARALVDRIELTITRQGFRRPGVILVDHGSPIEPVTAVRNQVGKQLRRLLGERCHPFSVASMERREGPQYDFNEPLLETVLRRADYVGGEVIVAPLFLSAGRHAGEGGDIAQICLAAEKESPALTVARTETLADHPLIEDILTERAKATCPAL